MSLALQASFDPPGFTVAVKRDRAAEALLLTGSRFVVNIIAEGAEKVSLAYVFDATSQDAYMLLCVQSPPAPSEWRLISTCCGDCFVLGCVAFSNVALHGL